VYYYTFDAYRRRDSFSVVTCMLTFTCITELVVAAMLPFVVIVVSAFLYVEPIVAASLLI
jgi:hypothetical protein